MKPSIYIWVISPNEFNSLFIQVKYHVEILSKLYGVEPTILHPKINNVRQKLKEIQQNGDLLFWHYGSFDKYLIGLNTSRIIFVYHNITPAHFFWKNDFLVGLKSCVGQFQLKTISKSSQWITMSSFNKSELTKMGFKNIKIFPNIIEKQKIDVRKNEEPSLLYVGRISPNKNCIELLRAVKKVCNSTTRTIVFTIVGNGKNKCKYFKKFKKELEELSLLSNLKLIWKTDLNVEELSIIYQQSWLYISSSKHEGFGVPACESILHGTPALYFSCGGQESVLLNQGLIPVLDEINFHERILEMLNDKIELNKLLENQMSIVENYEILNVLENSKFVFDDYFSSL